MYAIDLGGKNALVFGVANQRSIAWHIARALDQAGAGVTLSYLNERIRSSVEKLSGQLSSAPALIECDVSDDASVASAFEELESEVGTIDIVVHSIAFANRDDLGGPFIDTPREGFRIALDISAYSLVSVARAAAPLMKDSGGQHSHDDIPGLGARVPRLQRHGNRQGRARERGQAARLGPRTGQHPNQRDKCRAGRYPLVASDQRIPRHEAGAR